MLENCLVEVVQYYGIQFIPHQYSILSAHYSTWQHSVYLWQICLVDLLRHYGIHPAGMVGHSVGELGCAYADNTLTREQTIMAAYYRGLVLKQASLPQGAMASVGE